MADVARSPRRRLWTLAFLVLLVALGFGARAIRVQHVMRGDSVVFPVGDAYYHLRLAEYTLANPPHLLRFDPLVNHPDGAWIPWPPLHTGLLAGVAGLLGGTRHALDLAAAWIPPVTGALLVVPVFFAGALLAGRRTGLAASLLVALLPISIAYSGVGDADHHATVALFGAVWLLGALRVAREGESSRERALSQALVLAGRLGVLLTWAGSLLYLVIGDGAVVAVLALRGRRDALPAHALGLVFSALVVAALVPALGPTVGGPFSTIALSFLQPAAMLALACVAAGAAWLERRRPAPSARLRVARGVGLAVIAGAALLALPGLLPSLRESLEFVGKDDPWAARNAEQRPLWSPARPTAWRQAAFYYGGFALLVPLLPLLALYRAREARTADAWLVYGLWSTGFGALALAQLRYGSDFAPAAAIGAAASLQTLHRALGGGRRARVATGLALVVGLGPILLQHTTQLAQELRQAPVGTPPADPLLATADGTLYRFAETIGRVTPDPGGYLDAAERPAYGILTPANVGHLIHYVARRATPSDNFGPYSGSRHFALAQSFFRIRTEQRAVRVSEILDSPYVLTVEYGPVEYRSLVQRLHREDGAAQEDEEGEVSPRWERFRLIAEGPAGGRPLSDLYGGAAAPDVAPYKLWERVEGAVLEVESEPGTPVEATLTLASDTGRRFDYVARAETGPDGVARLRVPYATDGHAPVRSLGPWRVRAGGRRIPVAVSEQDVREGRPVRVVAAGGSPASS